MKDFTRTQNLRILAPRFFITNELRLHLFSHLHTDRAHVVVIGEHGIIWTASQKRNMFFVFIFRLILFFIHTNETEMMVVIHTSSNTSCILINPDLQKQIITTNHL